MPQGRPVAQLTLLLAALVFATGRCYDILVRHPDQLEIPQCYSQSDHCVQWSDCCKDDRTGGDPSSVGITCEPVGICTNGSCSRPQGRYSVYMVTRCPAGAPTDLQVQCHSTIPGNSGSSSMALPVYSNRTGLLYKNAHCAACHGEPVEKSPTLMQLAESAIRCNGTSASSSSSAAATSCEPIAIVEAGQTHICYPSLVDTCQGPAASDQSLAEACERSPTSYDVCEETAYRNAYCRMCRMGWYAPQCLRSDYPLWQLRASLDTGLMGVYVSFRPLDSNRPGRGFGRRGANDTDSFDWSAAVDVGLYATHAVSMIGLATLLVLYLSARSLRNRPGVCLCSHAACVLTMEALTVTSRALQPTAWPCLVVLLACYFCLTGATVWAAVFGFDLLRCIVRSAMPAVARGSSRPLLAVWAAPAILTGCLGGLHARLGLFDLAVCQFAPCHKWLMLGVSLGPLGAALAFNLSVAIAVCAVLRCRASRTARIIGRGGRPSKTSSSTSTAGRLVGTTVRVSVAMGAAWLPHVCLSNIIVDTASGGDVSMANAWTVASIAAKFLAAAHGVLLAGCFCCSRRVRLAARGSSRSQSRRVPAAV